MLSKLNKKGLYNLVFGTYRTVDYFFSSLFPVCMPKPNENVEIDVVVPAVAKDTDTLPACIEGIRANVANKIGCIYLVAPRGQGLEETAKALDLTFVHEKDVLGYGPDDIEYVNGGYNRSGWIFQQMLKLSGNIGTKRYYLTVDADHIILRPHTFLDEGGRSVFYVSKEYYYPYYTSFKHLFGRFPYQRLSYVAHKMMFDKQRLALLKQCIEQRSGMRWDEAIINLLKSDETLSFSEFETYGNLFPKSEKTRISWREKTLCKTDGTSYDFDALRNTFSGKYLSVTLPYYKKVTTC